MRLLILFAREVPSYFYFHLKQLTESDCFFCAGNRDLETDQMVQIFTHEKKETSAKLR